MKLALRLAAKGAGWVSPNPMVGAVVVKDGHIVGQGYHRRVGAPHAEVEALRQAGDAARGADLYVTLEPCNHQGRTPPCTQAILAAGVSRVIIATPDPNPQVAGGGAAYLQAQGVAVEVGATGGRSPAPERGLVPLGGDRPALGHRQGGLLPGRQDRHRHRREPVAHRRGGPGLRPPPAPPGGRHPGGHQHRPV